MTFSNKEFNVSSFFAMNIELMIGIGIFHLQIDHFQNLILNENDHKKFENSAFQSNQELF